jgi:hypothetical protein
MRSSFFSGVGRVVTPDASLKGATGKACIVMPGTTHTSTWGVSGV